MANVNLGERFEAFIQQQIREGRYQNASEVVRAGLRLLEDHEAARHMQFDRKQAATTEAKDDSQPSVPMDDMFDHREARYPKRKSAAEEKK